MDEPRAQTDDGTAVAIAGLERRFEDAIRNGVTGEEVALIREQIAALRSLVDGEVRRIDQVNSLQKESVSVALVAAEKAVTAALAAADKATDKAEASTRDSLDKVNEFRGALDDLGKTMATRRELDDFKTTYGLAHETLRAQVGEIGSRLDKQPEVRALERGASIVTGRASGVGDTLNVGHAVLLLVIAILGIYVALH